MAAKIHYKMRKQDKIMLASILDPHERGVQRRLIVAADLHALTTPKTNPLDKEKKSRVNRDDSGTE
jgi:hypothetical protein